MQPSRNCYDLIKEFEGLFLTPCLRATGVWTIGYGAILDLSGEPVTKDTPTINKKEAEDLLHRDVESCGRAVTALISVSLSQNQFDALVSFIFEFSPRKFEISILRHLVNTNQHHDIPNRLVQLSNTNNRTSRVLRRRTREAALYAQH